MKRQGLRWTRVHPGAYQVQVEEGILKAMFGKSGDPRDRFYSLTLVDKTDNELARTTLYIESGELESGQFPVERDSRLLLKYVHLIEEIPGIPVRAKPGFKALTEELQDREETVKSSYHK